MAMAITTHERQRTGEAPERYRIDEVNHKQQTINLKCIAKKKHND